MTEDVRPAQPMPLDEALSRIRRDYVPVTSTEDVPLAAACGRILAEPVTAPVDVPPVAMSAMDGFAVASTAPRLGPGDRFALVGRVPAGTVFDRPLAPGQAVRIFTGAAVPAGADTVAMQEDCRIEGDTVVVTSPVARGANIRPAGEDMRAGAVVLRPGTRLRPQEVGLAAAVGRPALHVRARLRAVLLSTGDELREPGEPRPAGAIYDANRYTVGAQLRALGVQVRDLGIVTDQLPAVRHALADAAASGADLIVTSGGASVGEEDHVRAAVSELGAIDFWKLALRPGKPLALGAIGGSVVLGLPGNPVSAMVTFMLVGRPLVLRLSGADEAPVPRSLAVAGFAYRKRPGRREFLRVRVEPGEDGRPVARKFPVDSSGVLTSMVEADGLVDVPAEAEAIDPGDIVGFLPFSGLLG